MQQMHMATNLRQLILAFLVMFGAAVGLTACDTNEGPVEETGEAMEEAGDEIEDETDN